MSANDGSYTDLNTASNKLKYFILFFLFLFLFLFGTSVSAKDSGAGRVVKEVVRSDSIGCDPGENCAPVTVIDIISDRVNQRYEDRYESYANDAFKLDPSDDDTPVSPPDDD